jgi:PncC family amidohydrolase
MKKEEEVGRALIDRGLTIAVAESCTGGLISSRITDVPGSSGYFEAGFVTYSNSMKEKMLGVPMEIIEEKGAVSEETARSMAEGARRKALTSVGLAVTGIAGPSGGTEKKPVGLVYLGLAAEEGTWVRKCLFTGDRDSIKGRASEEALCFALDYLEERLP